VDERIRLVDKRAKLIHRWIRLTLGELRGRRVELGRERAAIPR